jgi:hypothetical protein
MNAAEHGSDKPAGGDEPESAKPDDGGVIDDVVDEILGEHLPPPKPEDPWERRQRILETTTTVILSLAAVATAWATFQASQWSQRENNALSDSSVSRSKAIEATSQAARTEQLDTTIWLQWLAAFRAGDRAQANFLRDRFRPGLLQAQKAWVAKAVVAPDGRVISAPTGTPFTEKQYAVPEAARADALTAEADNKLTESQDASDMSVSYVLVALVFALVLFFAGIATKFRNPKLQTALVALALAFGVFGLVRMLTMKQLL